MSYQIVRELRIKGDRENALKTGYETLLKEPANQKLKYLLAWVLYDDLKEKCYAERADEFIQTIKSQFRKSICLNDQNNKQNKKRLTQIEFSRLKFLEIQSINAEKRKRSGIDSVEKSPKPEFKKRNSILEDVDFLFTSQNINTTEFQKEDVTSTTPKLKKKCESYQDKFYQIQKMKALELKVKIENKRQVLAGNERKKMRNQPLLSKNTQSIINTSFSYQKPLYKRTKELIDSKYLQVEKLKSIYTKSLLNEKDLPSNNLTKHSSHEVKQKEFDKKRFDLWIKDKNDWKLKKYLNFFAKNVENDFIETLLIRGEINKIKKNNSVDIDRFSKNDIKSNKLRKLVKYHLESISPYKLSYLIKN